MAGSYCWTRKCMGFGVAAVQGVVVSRVGPSTKVPSTSQSNAKNGSNTRPVAIIVVAATVSILLCLCIVVLVLWNKRRRQSCLRSDVTSYSTDSGDVAVPELTKRIEGQEEEEEEDNDDNEACNEGSAGRSRSATQRVEQLVVMAGEDLPTFLAHPAPAACNVQIQCPPLHL